LNQNSSRCGDDATMTGILMLDEVHACLRHRAREAFRTRDAGALLSLMDNTRCMRFVWDNLGALRDAEMYEAALFGAYMGTRTNLSGWHLEDLLLMFRLADRERLAVCRDPMPPGETFTVYRGVSGRGRARRVRGLSWTLDLDRAWWFARRLSYLGEPAVFDATVPRSAVFFYTNERKEQEMVLELPRTCRPRRCRVLKKEEAP
jgi:hypothetical protein